MIKRFVIVPELSDAQKVYNQGLIDLAKAVERKDSGAVYMAETALKVAFTDITAAGEYPVPWSAAHLVELDKAKRYLIAVNLPVGFSASIADDTDVTIQALRTDLAERGIHGCAVMLHPNQELTVTEAPWILALERRAARLGVAGQQVLADALRKVLKFGVSSEREARLVLTAQGVWGEDIDQILKNDLGECVACKTDRLVAVLTEDGKAWEAEGCQVCRSAWGFQAPKTLAEIPAGARRMTWDEVKVKPGEAS